MREIEFFGNSSKLKNQLRNSGLEGEVLSQSIDAWSMSMSKEKLNETVRSDEFLNSKLYTNTQKVQAIDIIDYSQAKNTKSLKKNAENSFSSKYNAQLVKTANSFFPSKGDLGQPKLQLNSLRSKDASPKKGDAKELPPLRHKPVKKQYVGYLMDASSIQNTINRNKAFSNSMKKKRGHLIGRASPTLMNSSSDGNDSSYDK